MSVCLAVCDANTVNFLKNFRGRPPCGFFRSTLVLKIIPTAFRRHSIGWLGSISGKNQKKVYSVPYSSSFATGSLTIFSCFRFVKTLLCTRVLTLSVRRLACTAGFTALWLAEAESHALPICLTRCPFLPYWRPPSGVT